MAIGATSLWANTTGSEAVAIGDSALMNNKTSQGNVAIGYTALMANDGGIYNVAVGHQSLLANTTGTYNTAIGHASMAAHVSLDRNVSIGYASMFLSQSGTFNTVVGARALYSNVTGASNVALGYMAGQYELGSDSFYVDNQDRTNTAGDKTKALIYGSFGTTAGAQQLTFNVGAIQGGVSKALTDAAAAASVWRVAVPTNGYAGGKIIWVATSTDATDQLVTSGEQFFAGADKAGTVTCGTGSQVGTATAYTTAKTLICTVTVLTATTNCDIQVTCTNNTAGTQAISFISHLEMSLPNAFSVQ
jgi:hypothetical protein